MNGFDILFLLILIWGAWKGWHSGFVQEVLGLAGLFLGLLLARFLYAQVGYSIAPSINATPSEASVIAFIGIWIGVPILLWIVGALLTEFLSWIHLGGLNHLAGSVFGALKYWVLLGAIANVLIITQMIPQHATENSKLFAPLQKTTYRAFNLAYQQWDVELPTTEAEEETAQKPTKPTRKDRRGKQGSRGNNGRRK